MVAVLASPESAIEFLLLLPLYRIFWIHVFPWLCCSCLPLHTGNPAQAMSVTGPTENPSVFVASQMKKN